MECIEFGVAMRPPNVEMVFSEGPRDPGRVQTEMGLRGPPRGHVEKLLKGGVAVHLEESNSCPKQGGDIPSSEWKLVTVGGYLWPRLRSF